MLHWISVSNYQSIRDEITLDFRAPGTTPDRPWLRHPTLQPSLRVPTVIVLIGPNGSGKTAWLRALADTIRFAVDSYGNPPGIIKHLFPAFASSEAQERPTRVEVEFDAPWWDRGPDEPDRVFRYIIELHRGTKGHFPDTVGYEALYDFPRGRLRRLVERRPHRPVYVAKDLSIKPSDDRLASVPVNASVLSTLARVGLEKIEAIVQILRLVITNVTPTDPIRLDTATITDFYRGNPQVMEKMSDRLRRFDLGIERMVVEQWPDGGWRLVLTHGGLDRILPVESESAGTRHIVHMFPVLNYALEVGGVAIMDALDNDLHADLVDEILNWFRRTDTNARNAQLICSLHGLSVLDDLEKEEVFIVEKKEDGATRAYGVSEVQGVRRSSDLRKLYRGGALGGLPYFG